MNKNISARLQITASMIIFGTVGIFVKFIPLSAAVIAACRGIIGVLFLLAIMLLKRERVEFKSLKSNLLLLALSGAAVGFNWVLLFESYKHTTVSIATLCYYFSPIFVIIISPFLLLEKPTLKGMLAAVLSICGMFFISGLADGQVANRKGIAFALGAALLYASVVIINKKIKGISPMCKTTVQLFFAAAVVAPYSMFTGDFNLANLKLKELLLLVAVGVLHTGIAYFLYFSSLINLPAQTAAIYSYMDPAIAVLLSAIVLSEKITVFTLLGALFILGGSFINEVSFKNIKK